MLLASVFIFVLMNLFSSYSSPSLADSGVGEPKRRRAAWGRLSKSSPHATFGRRNGFARWSSSAGFGLRGGGFVEEYDDEAEKKELETNERRKLREIEVEERRERIKSIKVTISSLQKDIRQLENEILAAKQEEEQERIAAQRGVKETAIEKPSHMPKVDKKSHRAKKVAEEEYEEEDENKLMPNDINGGAVVGGYPAKWGQSIEELWLEVPIPKGKLNRDAIVECTPRHLKIGFKGDPWMIDGDVYEPLKSDECFWSILDGKINIQVPKLHGKTWWPRVLPDDPNINCRKCVPVEERISDLDDPELRQSVEKMMWKKKMKDKGVDVDMDPNKRKVVEEFKKAHPDMDFSKAQISAG